MKKFFFIFKMAEGEIASSFLVFAGFVFLINIILIVASFSLIIEFYNITSPRDSNLITIYGLSIAWFVIFWAAIIFAIVIVSTPQLKMRWKKWRGTFVQEKEKEKENNGSNFFLIFILGYIITIVLLGVTAGYINTGPHYQDLYTAYSLLIAAIVLGTAGYIVAFFIAFILVRLKP